MKLQNFLFLILVSMSINACRDNGDLPSLEGDFPEAVGKILPKVILDDMKQKGMMVYEGFNPPIIEGNFKIDPFQLLSRYGAADSHSVGKVIEPQFFRFYGQNKDKNTVSVDYTNKMGDRGSGIGAFISGHGNKFSLFMELQGNNMGTTYKHVALLSGAMTSEGTITDLQYAIYLKEKNQKPGTALLIPVNTGRIWIDGDQITERTNSFAP